MNISQETIELIKKAENIRSLNFSSFERFIYQI
jgi:hypothetical protein